MFTLLEIDIHIFVNSSMGMEVYTAYMLLNIVKMYLLQ